MIDWNTNVELYMIRMLQWDFYTSMYIYICAISYTKNKAAIAQLTRFANPISNIMRTYIATRSFGKNNNVRNYTEQSNCGIGSCRNWQDWKIKVFKPSSKKYYNPKHDQNTAHILPCANRWINRVSQIVNCLQQPYTGI